MKTPLAPHFYQGILPALKKLPSAALVTATGVPLYLKPATLCDIGTLALTAETVQGYLKLQVGEVAITNDPHSGATSGRDYTLVTPLKPETSSGMTLLLVSRFRLRPTLKAGSFPVPPSPIAGRPEYEAVQVALTSHPLAPTELKGVLPGELRKLAETRMALEKQIQLVLGEPLKKATIEDFFAKTRRAHSRAIEDLPLASITSNFDLGKNEKLNIEINNSPKGLQVELSGGDYEAPLTREMTAGVVLGAVNSFVNCVLPLNQGQLQNIEVRINCPGLSANASRTSVLSELITAPALANSILETLGRFQPRSGLAAGAIPMYLEIEFSNGKALFERLPGGTGANHLHKGIVGADQWSRLALNPSIEELERLYPITVLRSEKRSDSGGRGQRNGGDGVRRSFSIHESCTLRWRWSSMKAAGFGGGSSGDEPMLSLSRSNGESLHLPQSGELKLNPNDTLTLLSGGGGGAFRLETKT